MTIRSDGYNSELRSFDIVPDAKTQVSLALKLKEGSLATINGENMPKEARVSVNGIMVNLPYQTAPGDYRIHLERNNFLPIDMSLNLKPAQSITLSPEWQPASSVKVKRRMPGIATFAASMVVPGLGQHIQKHNMRGIIYEGLVAGLGVFALVSNMHHHNTLDEYLNIQKEIINESQGKSYLTPELRVLYDEQKKSYDKAKSARSLTLTSQLLLGLAWGINAFDAGFFTGYTPQSGSLAIESLPAYDQVKLSVAMAF